MLCLTCWNPHLKLNAALHIPTESRAWHLFRILRTFVIVNIGWYFDRNGFMRGLLCLQKTFTDFRFDSLAANAPAHLPLFRGLRGAS